MKGLIPSIIVFLLFNKVIAQQDISGVKPHPLIPHHPNFYISKLEVDSHASMIFVNPREYVLTSAWVSENPPKIKAQGVKTTVVFKLKQGMPWAAKDVGEPSAYSTDIRAYSQPERTLKQNWVWDSGKKTGVIGYARKDSMKVESPVMWLEMSWNRQSETYVVVALEVKGQTQQGKGSLNRSYFKEVMHHKGYNIEKYKVDSNGTDSVQASGGFRKIKGIKYSITYRLKKGSMKIPYSYKGTFKGLPFEKDSCYSILQSGSFVSWTTSHYDHNYFFVIDKCRSKAFWISLVLKQVDGERLNFGEEYKVSITEVENLENLITIGRVELFTIYFNTDKYIFEPESEPTITRVIDFLNSNPKMKISVIGSADSTGSVAYNQKLSEKRADYICKVLTERGVSSSRLSPRGIGESSSETGKNKEESLQLNRKTVLINTSK